MACFIKKYKSPVANAKCSLEQSVSIQTLFGNIKRISSERCAKPLVEYDELYFWDLGKRASKEIAIGDTVYILTKDDLYRGLVAVHLHDTHGGIGDAIGWARQFKAPWENPIGFKEIQHYSVTPQVENIVNDSIHKGKEVVSNFFLLKGEMDLGVGGASTTVQENSFRKSQSTDSYKKINEGEPDGQNNYEELKESNNEIRHNYGSQLNQLLAQLGALKISAHHSEREHESLVEKFFEYLGYCYPQDIKYRVGHIDVLVNQDSPNSMVVEVKRDWVLNRTHGEVISQAYNYR